MEIIEVLKNIDLFKELDSEAAKALAKYALFHSLKPKEAIFNEGFEGSYFYILLKGSIRIFKTSYDGKESTIKIIRPGEFFAEVALFKKTNYPASAIATEKSEVIAIHRDSFWEMMDHTDSRDKFLGGVFAKLRFLTDQIHHLSALDVEERFLRFLIKNYGKKYKYDITIPKKDIASAIGTLPETFSRILLRLTKMGIIAWKKNTLIIKDGFWDNEYFEDE